MLALALVLLPARAEYPIIGADYRDTGSSTNLTSPTFVVSINTNDFSYLGTPVQTNDPGFCGFNFGDGANDIICQQPFIGSMCVDVEFNWTGQEMEIRGFAHDGTISISDGINTTNYIPLWDDGAAHRLFVKYPESATRKMRIYMDCTGAGTNLFSGIYLNSGDSISRITTPSKTLMVMGDSYVTAYTAFDNVTPWSESYALLVANSVTNLHAIPSGLTGTGIWNNGPNSGETNYINRFNINVESNNPNWTVIQVSLNDENYNVTNGPGYFNLCTNLFCVASNQYPNHIAILGALNPYTPFGGIDANEVLLNSNSMKAAQAWGIPYFDALGAGVINNFSTDIGPDGVHPTPLGYIKIANFLISKMQATFPDFPSTATNINVTSYGAVGNAQIYNAVCVSNSPLITLSATNLNFGYPVQTGDVVQVFGVGPHLYSGTNLLVDYQDIICYVTNVDHGTNVYINILPGVTTNIARCVIGTNCTTAFTLAINDASNIVSTGLAPSVILNIPPGMYLILPPSTLDPNAELNNINGATVSGESSTAINISSGGITFNGLGGSPTNTIIMACGAGMCHAITSNPYNYQFYPVRGTTFIFQDPIQNYTQPLIFNNLTFDGGATNASWQGIVTNNFFPQFQENGYGWDVGNHLGGDQIGLFNTPSYLQTFQLKEFTNCIFRNWKGEVLICFTGPATNATTGIYGCTVNNLTATFDNMYYGQSISNCLIMNLQKVVEYFQGNAFVTDPFMFFNNTVSNCYGNYAMVFNGSVVGTPPNNISLLNNFFYYTPGYNGPFNAGVTPSPIGIGNGNNIVIGSNILTNGAGNNTIVFSGNLLQSNSAVANVTGNITITNNRDYGANTFLIADGSGYFNVLAAYNLNCNVAFGGGFITNIDAQFNTNCLFTSASINSGNYILDETNNVAEGINIFGQGDGRNISANNQVAEMTYGYGRYHWIWQFWTQHNTGWYLDTNLIPATAMMEITNSSGNSGKLYFDSSQTTFTPIQPLGDFLVYWSTANHSWSLSPPTPPVIVTNLSPLFPFLLH